MIGPDGYLHRWTAPRKKSIQRVMEVNASNKSLAERLRELKIYATSVLSLLALCVHLTKQHSTLRIMPFNIQLQDRTMLFLPTF